MKNIVDSNRVLFSNNYVTLYSDYFLINLYYFPFGKKKIFYKNIRSCEFRSTGDLDMFSYKLWGMSLTPVQWHCDWKRLGRKFYILIDANQWPSIGITMDDEEIAMVYNLIKQQMDFNHSMIYQEKLPIDSKNSMKT